MKKALIFLMVVVVFLSTAAVSSSSSRIRILAPADESFLGLEEIIIIGSVEEEGSNGKAVQIRDNDRVLGAAPLRGNTFNFRAKLAEGRHEVAFSLPGVEPKSIILFVGRQGSYRYHMAREGSSCPTCHREADRNRFSIGHQQADICSQCHDPIGNSDYVHGPVAAGSCTPCHDPHGSRYRKFLVTAGKELCLDCHSQNLSRQHVEERQNADCVKCHDPHSSIRNYHLR